MKIIHQRLPDGFVPGFSRTRAVVISVFGFLVCFSVLSVFSGAWLALPAVALALWLVQLWRRHVSARHPRAVCALYPHDAGWRVRRSDGSFQNMSLGAGTYTDALLIVVELVPRTGGRLHRRLARETLLLFPDQFDASTWQELLLHCNVRKRLHAV